MFVKMAKGDTLSRALFFKHACDNKMIDQVNTERYTILASKTVRLIPPNRGPTNIGIGPGIPTADTPAIASTKIIDM